MTVWRQLALMAGAAVFLLQATDTSFAKDLSHLYQKVPLPLTVPKSLGPQVAAELRVDAPALSFAHPKTKLHRGMRVSRHGLLWDGYPVFNGYLVGQTDSKGYLRRVKVSATPADWRAGHPTMIENDHEWLSALGFVPMNNSDGELGYYHTQGHLVPVARYYVVANDPWKEPLALFLDTRGTIPFVVATERLRFDDMPMGAVYPINPISTPSLALVPLEHLDEGTSHLYGAFARVESCVDHAECEETHPVAVRQDNVTGHYIFVPQLEQYTFDDPFAEVSAYHHVSEVNRWVRDRFGWDHLFGEETSIDVKVGMAWYNAAFYPATEDYDPFILFGQDIIDFAYDAQVAYHEFGHALNRSLWPHAWFVRDEYGIDTAPFGLEEGLADIWAITFSGHPEMNQYMTAGRNADNDKKCPGDLQGEGHKEAWLIAGFGWDLRESIGADDFDQILYRAIQFLEPDANFKDFAQTLDETANEMSLDPSSGVSEDHSDTIAALGFERGFYDEACTKRLVPLEEGASRRVYGYGKNRTGHRSLPFGLQWKLTVPHGMVAFELMLERTYPHQLDDGYKVALRRQEPVGVSWLDPHTLKEGEPVFELDADLVVEGSPEVVHFPVFGQPGLSPGEEIYVLLVTDTDQRLLIVSGSVEYSSSPAPAMALDLPPVEGSSKRRSSSGCQQMPYRSPSSFPSLILSSALFLTR